MPDARGMSGLVQQVRDLEFGKMEAEGLIDFCGAAIVEKADGLLATGMSRLLIGQPPDPRTPVRDTGSPARAVGILVREMRTPVDDGGTPARAAGTPVRDVWTRKTRSRGCGPVFPLPARDVRHPVTRCTGACSPCTHPRHVWERVPVPHGTDPRYASSRHWKLDPGAAVSNLHCLCVGDSPRDECFFRPFTRKTADLSGSAVFDRMTGGNPASRCDAGMNACVPLSQALSAS